jgi:hypothetical protein
VEVLDDVVDVVFELVEVVDELDEVERAELEDDVMYADDVCDVRVAKVEGDGADPDADGAADPADRAEVARGAADPAAVPAAPPAVPDAPPARDPVAEPALDAVPDADPDAAPEPPAVAPPVGRGCGCPPGPDADAPPVRPGCPAAAGTTSGAPAGDVGSAPSGTVRVSGWPVYAGSVTTVVNAAGPLAPFVFRNPGGSEWGEGAGAPGTVRVMVVSACARAASAPTAMAERILIRGGGFRELFARLMARI